VAPYFTKNKILFRKCGDTEKIGAAKNYEMTDRGKSNLGSVEAKVSTDLGAGREAPARKKVQKGRTRSWGSRQGEKGGGGRVTDVQEFTVITKKQVWQEVPLSQNSSVCTDKWGGEGGGDAKADCDAN